MTGKLNLSKSLRLAVLQTGRSIDEAIEEHGDYDEMCKALMLRGPAEAETFPVLEGVFHPRSNHMMFLSLPVQNMVCMKTMIGWRH